MVDTEEFALMTPNLSPTRRRQILPFLQAAFVKFDISTQLREAHAMAQLLHESGSFIYKREIASGAAYEGRRDLGNTQPGDGRRYKGRGWIQVTGRYNYRKFGHMLGIDLEENPLLAETDENAALIACAYWADRDLNKYADRDDLNTITRRINGGLNGIADRRAKLRLAKNVLSADDPDAPDPEEPFVVRVQGVDVSNEGFMAEDNRVWVPLRPVTNALGVTITEIEGDEATVRSSEGEVVVPFVIRGKTGFARVRDLAEGLHLNLDFNPDERFVALR